ncbi:Very-long-chain (3R)-3-hydroxyacyl-[acyl-carrier protein] dehydratase PASTICCINO 2 [Tritrichomonas foetus]|uniref:very-long-chain (3R)-3-hydroxyacyl-CoA dehydratase n=1 Tax=Tritrichomonas foetus TaxID=1144522 RepID=A0A1J4K048_9EUKA|nr:Very-long-chain (3R)-3-hydroxyacyl-[acyl-carrier protein] dehydratase PASTICCINO 2 [Tritrichomonas foetus]|eukprot:OHT04104.1 Very-long-chain (3R)-3-hydroxyacyl-[acyl-carrier protein] dehydratase PASTICCINO 2 [Tritrichomonas foetus]
MGLYITLYNNLQTLLWACGLILMIVTRLQPEAIEYLNKYFIIVQTIMLLDIIHAVLKIVRGNIFATILQVLSRIYVVWMILPSQESPNLFNYLMFTAWSFAEIIRYQYYNHKNAKGVLLFLRYNAFIILYPIGVLLGEIPLIYQNYQATGFVFQIFVLSLYVPFFPYLYIHMLKLRKKNTSVTKVD